MGSSSEYLFIPKAQLYPPLKANPFFYFSPRRAITEDKKKELIEALEKIFIKV